MTVFHLTPSCLELGTLGQAWSYPVPPLSTCQLLLPGTVFFRPVAVSFWQGLSTVIVCSPQGLMLLGRWCPVPWFSASAVCSPKCVTPSLCYSLTERLTPDCVRNSREHGISTRWEPRFTLVMILSEANALPNSLPRRGM